MAKAYPEETLQAQRERLWQDFVQSCSSEADAWERVRTRFPGNVQSLDQLDQDLLIQWLEAQFHSDLPTWDDHLESERRKRETSYLSMWEARLMPRAPGWARGMIQRFLAWRERRVGPDDSSDEMYVGGRTTAGAHLDQLFRVGGDRRARAIEDSESVVTELFDSVRQR